MITFRAYYHDCCGIYEFEQRGVASWTPDAAIVDARCLNPAHVDERTRHDRYARSRLTVGQELAAQMRLS